MITFLKSLANMNKEYVKDCLLTVSKEYAGNTDQYIFIKFFAEYRLLTKNQKKPEQEPEPESNEEEPEPEPEPESEPDYEQYYKDQIVTLKKENELMKLKCEFLEAQQANEVLELKYNILKNKTIKCQF